MKSALFIFISVLTLLAYQIACGQIISNTEKSAYISAADDQRIKNLKNQADELYEAFDKNDFDKFVELTHPKIIEEAGSQERLAQTMREIKAETPKVFRTVVMSHKDPETLIKVSNQLFGVIPQKIEGTTLKNHTIVQEGCVVGVSTDDGKTWKFVSGEKFNVLFPSAADKVSIIKEKTFIDGVEK